MTTRIPCLLLSIVLLATGLATAQVAPDLAAAKQQEHRAMGINLNADDVPLIVLGPGDTELLGVLDSNSPTYDRIFTSVVSPGLACAATSTDSTVGDGVFYQQFRIMVTDTMAEDLLATVDAAGTTLDDTVLSLYCDFDPMDPTANLVAYNDDVSGSRLSAFELGNGTQLEPNVEYRLVISTFAPGDEGAFSIMLGGTAEDVPVEVQSFSVD